MRTTDYTGDRLDEKAAEWLAAIRAEVPPRPHLVLAPERSALLVIDMLRYFTHPEGRCYLDASKAIIPRLQSLIAAYRKLGRPVIFTRHCHRGPSDLGMLGRFFGDYIRRGEPDADILTDVAPLDTEPVIEKTTYDAFINTDLQNRLEDAGVEQVVITGVLTHMCCETTARSAFCRGFEVYLPVDGAASSREQLHVGALRNLADAAAVLMTAEEMLQRCNPTT